MSQRSAERIAEWAELVGETVPDCPEPSDPRGKNHRNGYRS